MRADGVERVDTCIGNGVLGKVHPWKKAQKNAQA